MGNTYTATENGAYSVEVTNADGYIRTSAAVMLVVNAIGDIGIERLVLAPNPFRDGFQLELHTTGKAPFVWDGSCRWEADMGKTLSVGRQLKEWISTPDLPAGAYLFGLEKKAEGSTASGEAIKNREVVY